MKKEKEKDRKLCVYPMSAFYNYEDVVPANVRVSTPEDCKKCSIEKGLEFLCNAQHCLIISKPQPVTEEELKFEYMRGIVVGMRAIADGVRERAQKAFGESKDTEAKVLRDLSSWIEEQASEKDIERGKLLKIKKENYSKG